MSELMGRHDRQEESFFLKSDIVLALEACNGGEGFATRIDGRVGVCG